MDDNIFVSMSVSKPILALSTVLLLSVGYYVPVTIVTTGFTMNDLVEEDSLRRYIIRCILVTYLPILFLSTLVYYNTSKTNTRLHSILLHLRTIASTCETLSLAVFSCITPHENNELHKLSISALLEVNFISMVLTILLVRLCMSSNPYSTISTLVKLAILLCSGFLHFSHPTFCTNKTDDCILSEAFFLPLFAVFQGSALLDIGGRSVVVRYKSHKEFEKNALEARHDRLRQQAMPDIENMVV